MKNNSFIWTDLSSYNPLKSIEFYQSIFNWKITEDHQYYIAHNHSNEILGIYETPAFFKKINMPHFWMNYIKVENTEQIVELAEKLGGIIEIANDEFHGGQIALLRDPMGAGFTIYQGNKLNQKPLNLHGSVIHRELHTSNAEKVIEFYTKLFNWKIRKNDSNNGYDIYTKESLKISSILELSNKMKGKYEYWITTFGVTNLQATKKQILNLGGSEISNEKTRILFTDPMGEAFFYIQEIE